jgi:transposase
MKPLNSVSADKPLQDKKTCNNRWRVDNDQVIRLWQGGKTCSEIARLQGVTYEAIRYHLKKVHSGPRANQARQKVNYNQKVNWRIYNEGLVKRGEVLLEISIFKDWAEELQRMNRGKPGRPFEFPNSFIEFLFRLKCGFTVGYRQVEGIARKLYILIPGCDKAPDYSTLQKRFVVLEVKLQVYQAENEQEVAIDSSGIKTSNRGEYKTLRYDDAKKKEYVKIHVEVNIKTNQVIACEVTSSGVHDSEVVDGLIKEGQKNGKINKGLMDSAYDNKKVYALLMADGIESGIKPARRGSLAGAIERYRRLKEMPSADLSKEERAALSRLGVVIEYLTDSQKWKDKVKYGKRWTVEGFFSAFKRIFSEHVFSRRYELMVKELKMKCSMMNLFRYICSGYNKATDDVKTVMKIPA